MAHAQLAPSPLEASQATTLPVIDISGLRSASLIERTRVSQQIGQACRDKGFSTSSVMVYRQLCSSR